MLIAGEASGDTLASELVGALRSQCPDARFIGAGGPKMVAAGVHLAFDLTRHSAIGLSWMKDIIKFRRLFNQLLALAIKDKPDAIIGVDYGVFNLRFGHAVKQFARKHRDGWDPKIIQFVSPQVWASRPGRANRLAADYNLLLCIFPFEKDWYAKRVPQFRVEFVGHPIVERYKSERRVTRAPLHDNSGTRGVRPADILLLPGSRTVEVQRHLPVMLGTLKLIQAKLPDARAKIVLPNQELKALAYNLSALQPKVDIQIGHLHQALAEADVAIASTGTVTMECAYFGVPTVTLYIGSWLTYQIAKRIVTVKSATMPNLLTNEEVYPEFIQDRATPENIAGAALELLQNEPRRAQIKQQLAEVISTLGGPGAPQRAAAAILSLFT
jgi:lipid-A-disaccharide synthase